MLDLTENSLKVLKKRYLKKNEKGQVVEGPEEMFRRVAKSIAAAEKLYDTKDQIKQVEEKFYQMMTNLEFMPNSPTLMNAGRDLGQLSACFVLPVEDSMEGIFDAIKHAALIHKSGGGTGFSFSRLRPKGATVRSTGGVASGPVSFMKVFNSATEAVKQGGTRRGANMGILRVDHPDILEFITCKRDNKDITNFNISVGITDKFMRAVEKGEDYDLIDPRTGKSVNRLNARKVFNLIVKMAWNNGEPGVVFLDKINADNPTPNVGEIESTNPCGEQPLLPYESCNLGSINLSRMVKRTKEGWQIDWDKLKDTVHWAVRFLDNVIDVNKYPLKEIEKMTKANRKIGLGVMGFADMLIKLGVAYNSEEGLRIGEKVMKFIDEESKQASAGLAKVRGVFPKFKGSIYDTKDGLKVRNATTTTIAPTGTISIICGTSSGIEPLFAVCFVRNVMDNEKLLEIHPIFEEIAREKGFYSKELMEKIAETGNVQEVDEVPQDVKGIFVTAHDISPEWHTRMQAVFQKYVDNAVSKTVNFPNEATQEDVKQVYLMAYDLGCKGITIYRDGSREEQVLNKGIKEAKQQKEGEVKELADSGYNLKPRPRPNVTWGNTEKVKIGCGNLYITVNSDYKGICEVFTNLGRAGGCPSQSEATSRLISLALRSGIAVESIVEQLKGIRCHSTIRKKGLKVLSCPDAIGRAIERCIGKKVVPNGTAQELVNNNHHKEDIETDSFQAIRKCPECGGPIEHEGGCIVCHSCGYSKCG